jgi:hypothetical protein
MIPLALVSPVGLVFPGLFAVGTLLPLLILAGLSSGAGKWLVGLQWRLSRISGTIILLAGIHDTLVYWLI